MDPSSLQIATTFVVFLLLLATFLVLPPSLYCTQKSIFMPPFHGQHRTNRRTKEHTCAVTSALMMHPFIHAIFECICLCLGGPPAPKAHSSSFYCQHCCLFFLFLFLFFVSKETQEIQNQCDTSNRKCATCDSTSHRAYSAVFRWKRLCGGLLAKRAAFASSLQGLCVIYL